MPNEITSAFMKITSLLCCFAFLITGVAWGEDSMTVEKFNTLVATPGDTNALPVELASFPIWNTNRCSVVMKFPDGRVLKEESVGTTKTIGGKYIVYSMDSQSSPEPLRAVIEYDARASAIKSWGISHGSLTVGTVVFEAEKKIAAESCTRGEFLQMSIVTYSDTEAVSRMWVYKNGVLAFTREATLRPMKGEPARGANRKTK